MESKEILSFNKVIQQKKKHQETQDDQVFQPLLAVFGDGFPPGTKSTWKALCLYANAVASFFHRAKFGP